MSSTRAYLTPVSRLSTAYLHNGRASAKREPGIMSFDDAIASTPSALAPPQQQNGNRLSVAVDDATEGSSFHPLDHPLTLAAPLRLTQVKDWHQHIPFAFTIVDLLRPRAIVELGVYRGDSFCAMCQAVDSLGLPTTCVGVDAWAGDIHTGGYDGSVYEDIATYVRERYASFATLWRMSFDDAIGEVEDGSIDLLHIDGTHSYDAARHDFDSWLSKLSERGVVLLHDINEHQENFGVYRLWDEMSQRYPSCAFLFGHGLGVVAVGANPPQPLLDLFAAMRSSPNVSRYFQILGERVLRMGQENDLAAAHAQLAAQAAEIARLHDASASLEMQKSVYAGEMARLAAENTQLTRQRATYDGQIHSLNSQLYSLRASRVYRASRVIAWPLKQAKRVARKARGVKK